TVAFLDLGAELARPAADRIGLEQREATVAVLFPDFELRFFLEEPHQDRRLLGHVLPFDLGEHLRGDRLKRAQGGTGGTVGVATRKQQRSGERRRRQKRADERTTDQCRGSPTYGFPTALPPNRYRHGTFIARRQMPHDSPFEHAVDERKVKRTNRSPAARIFIDEGKPPPTPQFQGIN